MTGPVASRLSGFGVTAARDGGEAVRSASESCPDVIVVGIDMPARVGVDVIASPCATDRSVPVWVLPAPCSVDDRLAGFSEAGADDGPVKPFVLAQLVGRVRAPL